MNCHFGSVCHLGNACPIPAKTFCVTFVQCNFKTLELDRFKMSAQRAYKEKVKIK